jgi:hypothetical protein
MKKRSYTEMTPVERPAVGLSASAFSLNLYHPERL